LADDGPDVRTIDRAILRLFRARRVARGKINKELAATAGVRLPSSVLLAMECLEEGACGLSQLGRLVGLSIPAISRQIQGLERMGLVERVPDESDGRAAIIQLTQKGHQVAHEQHAARIEFLLGVLKEWDDADLQRLAVDLDRLSTDFAIEAGASGQVPSTKRRQARVKGTGNE
jgi:DNA-binding MarR family transcriptional regulator